ncbi:MAG: LemA family protein [Oligoflexia bacterium]|jgi:LemA protein
MKKSLKSVLLSWPVLVWLVLGSHLSSCGYNRIQGLDEDSKAAWSEVLNQYQRRSDLVPNLVSTVKGYAKHEAQTLEAVVNARAKATSMTIDAKSLSNREAFQKFQAAQGELSQALGRLMAISENYPQLKANENFRDLQSQLEGTENRIAVARRRYIESVAEYNKLVRFFPTNLTARFLLSAEMKETFSIEEAAKKNPEVKFE